VVRNNFSLAGAVFVTRPDAKRNDEQDYDTSKRLLANYKAQRFILDPAARGSIRATL